MIAIDTCSLVAFLENKAGDDVEKIDFVVSQNLAVFPPIVVSELLSDPKLDSEIKDVIEDIPILPVMDDYWSRAGYLRSKLLKKSYKARMADALVAQSCIDHDVPLITRDKDFRRFSTLGGLKLY